MGDAGLPPLQPLPEPHITNISDGIHLLEPLSRRGHGLGLVILTSGNASAEESISIKNYVPPPLVKWAEEGYAVAQIQQAALSSSSNGLKLAVDALKQCSKRDAGKIGIVAYDVSLWQQIESSIASFPELAGAIIYSDAQIGVVSSPLPCVQHLHGKASSKLPRSPKLTAYEYPTSTSQTFASPVSPDFDYSLEAVSHTRNLTFLKRHDILGGPTFDLEEIWDEHTYYEFGNRSVQHTMATMVQEPYVNHVPTMTGGIGREALTHFYTHNFVYSNPADTELELISRTVGVDRIVDEFIFKCTHDRMMDWLLPAVPPTGVYLEISMIAIVCIRGDRLYHEHISWDQGTVLRQIEILPEYLAWPYRVPEEKYVEGSSNNTDAEKQRLELQLPIAGKDTANKMREKNSVLSNKMFEHRMRRL